ncbi:CHAT domain-containing protein [Phaeobacter sp. 11ANDIMAR09]|uniref:CHAT domain-containing protein n=1 Tax=Phaeobacter sp. 11ANDIMAR09 TaxID=1225647 RepID=UPI0006D6E2A6|nr:CHAT domain-containing protein [Phaeobacter sp. 11ANDIMAR09]KPD13146.1 hypothetical protein AN476_07590 [Phaeobacter sp. 11ANDIMAR09]
MPDTPKTNLLHEIHYLIPVEDGAPNQATLMQGFAPSLCENSHFLRGISLLPSSISELSPSLKDARLPIKISGQSPLSWAGQSPKALTRFLVPEFSPFVVIFFGPNHNILDYQEWINAHAFPLVTVSTKGARISSKDFSLDLLRDAFVDICKSLKGKIHEEERLEAIELIESWEEPSARDIGFKVGGHNSVAPNLCALSVMGFEELIDGPFSKIGSDISPYVEQISKTAKVILDERHEIGERKANQLFRPTPELNLYAPSIYPHFKTLPLAGAPVSTQEQKKFIVARNSLVRQKGYSFTAQTTAQKGTFWSEGEDKPSPHFLLRMRAQELSFGTECIGVLAASECSAVVRLPNEINKTAGQVRMLAQQHHAKHTTERKRTKLFQKVQRNINEAVPADFLPLIERNEHGVRVVSDTHLEWLDVKGLPLSIQKNVSRIPVTPGNLFVNSISPKRHLHLTPSSFEEVLVISALKRDDPISPFMPFAISGFRKELEGKVKVRTVQVANEDELVDALNAFDGAMLIFDGHGSHRSKGAAKIHLEGMAIDVWKLSERKIRIPPIVILSACDTHAADRNHATTANGFLSLGARSVLASVFPLHAIDAAAFIGRLLHRVANFIPGAHEVYGRSLSWLEIVSGMIRMQLLRDYLATLEKQGHINEQQFKDLHLKGNFAINGLAKWPFEEVITALTELGIMEKQARRELRCAVANSSAISYLHVGRPETILVHSEKQISEIFQ